MKLYFRWVHEDAPDAAWLALLKRAWPSYREWFLREGDDARPGVGVCRRKLREFMPELVPMWDRLVALAGGDHEIARMLALYRPAAYLAGCSQAVWTRGAPVMVRNYDYLPAACEGVFLLSNWSGNTRVLATSDCLWGALDGMNEHGLVVALAFAGSRRIGDGFGIPLILRYVLETCRTVDEATAVLRRVPSHMAYNVSLLDEAGDYAVASLVPDGPTTVERRRVTTNHLPYVHDLSQAEWPGYTRATRSLEREQLLAAQLRRTDLTRDGLVQLFLQPPLYRTEYSRGMGTIYTAAYHPSDLRADYLWPHGRFAQSFDSFREQEVVVNLVETPADRAGGGGDARS